MTVIESRGIFFTPTKETNQKSESPEEYVQQIEHTRSILQGTNGGEEAEDTNTGWKDPEFRAADHLAIDSDSPPERITFDDMNLAQPASASSDVAGTMPFSLFSPKAIPSIRKALFNPRYIQRTGVIFGPKTLILRNTAAHSPFFRRLWTHPSVMRALSAAAGVELEPVMETFELGHANVQVDFSKYEGLSDKDKLMKVSHELTAGQYAEVHQSGSQSFMRSQEEIKNQVDGSPSLLPWHYDSYPWVCVAMISDTSDMVGGETVVQQGDGVYQGFSQPGMGSAVMLQGGLVKHLALPSAGGSGDRITIITSFRAKAVGIYDSSFMSNIRPYSDLIELYRQWIEYRMARLKPGLRRLRNRRQFLKAYDAEDLKEDQQQLLMLKEYAKRTLRQMVPPALVASTVERLGMNIFYTVRDDFINNAFFKDRAIPCNICSVSGVVDKTHLAVCPGAKKWRPENPVWKDLRDTKLALMERDISMFPWGYAARFSELQTGDYVARWHAEKRPWSMADELAVQGLTEYLIEFLEMFGVRFVNN